MQKQKGISMVSLVITIIIILILSAIVFVSSGKTMGEADYSKYVTHVSEVNTAFMETTRLVNGKMIVKNQYNQAEQVYNYVAKNGTTEEDVLKVKEIPKYTILEDEGQFGINLPKMTVESGTGKKVPVKYATTKNGQIFTWPPYDYDNKFYITDKDTVENKMQTEIKVGDEEFKIKIDFEDGSLLEWDGPIEDDEDIVKPPEEDKDDPSEHTHNFTAKVQTPQYFCSDATCLVPTKYYYKCIGCDEKGSQTFTVGAALGHTYGEQTVIKEGSCSESGTAQSKCTRCGDTLNLEVPKDSTKHSGREIQQITQEATCATEGVKTYKCSACSTVLRTEAIAKTEHNSEKVVVTKEAGCTTKGAKTYRCSGCNKEMKTEEIDALGHNEDSSEITKTPTCNDTGTRVYTCSRCNNAIRTEEIPVDKSRHYGSTETQTIQAATCTVEGITTKRCSLCKDTIGSGTIAALGHAWNSEEPPRICNRCGLEELGDADPILAANSTWYSQGGTTINRNQISSITIANTYNTNGKTIVDQWDASINSTGASDNNGPVTAYIEDDGLGQGTYKLTLAGNGQGKIYANEDSSYTFGMPADQSGDAFINMTTLNGAEILDTSKATTLEGTFRYARNLRNVDVSNWDVRNVTSLKLTFAYCVSLENLNLSNWNVGKVTSMYYTFASNSSVFGPMKLTTIGDVSNWDTRNVEDMYCLFQCCSNLTSVNVGKWDTSKVTNMRNMFSSCELLTELDVATKTVTLNGRTYMAWDTSNVKTFRGMFSTESNAFKGKITKLEVENWDTSSAEDMHSMFNGCALLTELDLSNWDVSKVTDMAFMFADCRSMKMYDFTGWDTSNVTTMNCMFNDNQSLKTIDVSDFDTQNVTMFTQLFELCANLEEIIGLEKWDTTSGVTMLQMFNNSPKIKELNLSSFDTSSVVNICQMFGNCRSLERIYVSEKWDMSNLVDNKFNQDGVPSGTKQHVFRGCERLIGGAGTIWAQNHIEYIEGEYAYDYMYAHIDGGTENPGYLTSGIYLSYANIAVGLKSDPACVIKVEEFQNYTNISYSIVEGDEYVDINTVTGQVTGVKKGVATIKVTVTNANGKILSAITNISITDGNPILASSDTWFSQGGTQIKRTSITEIEIKNRYNASGNDTYYIKWDASEAKDGSVMVYVEGTKLIIAGDGSGVVYANPDSSYAFSESTGDDRFKSLTTFNGGNIFNTSKATTMKSMFQHAVKLTSIDVSNWDVSKVEDMYCMFAGNSSSVGPMAITSLAVDNWNVGKVKDFTAMFQTCSNLININVSNWSMNSATNTRYLFKDCSLLKTIDVSNWNTSGITDMSSMFSGCNKLERIDVSNWDTSSVTNMTFMFNNCNALEALNMSDFDTSGVTDMSAMFQHCNKLKTVGDTSNFDTSSCTLFSWMFNNCNALEEIDVSGWDVSKTTGMTSMFRNCHKLTEIKGIGNWIVSTECIYMPYMFQHSSKIRSLDLSGFDTSNANLNEMFVGMSGLDTITLGEKFSFSGDGSGPCVLPTPSFSDSTGLWYRLSDWAEFEPANVPSNEAATYVAMKICYLDINYILDNEWYYGAMSDQPNVYCVDIYFDGVKKAAPGTYVTVNGEKVYGFVDYWTQHPYGTTYEIKNMQVGDGYTYLGLNYGSTASGILTHNTGYEPKFKTNKYTVSFNANGGTGTMDDVTLTCHKPEMLPVNGFTKEGYGFAGWATSPNGNIVYSNGQEVSNLTYTDDDNVELYAIWAEPGVLAYSDTWFTQGNAGITRASITEIEVVEGLYTPSGVEGSDYIKWDASATHDESVIAYVEGTKLTLAGNKIYANADSSFVFSDKNKEDCFSELTQIKNIELIDTSKATTFERMFYKAQKLTNVNINNWNTSNVTNLAYTFAYCVSLENLDLSKWDVSKVTSMHYTFGTYTTTTGNMKLKSIGDVSNWNTSKVTTMSTMFQGCANLENVNVTDWNTSNVTSLEYMFSGCNSLKNINVSNWNTAKVTSMRTMFAKCHSIESLDLSRWDVSKVTDMQYMFGSADDSMRLKSIGDVSRWDTSNVTNIRCMFQKCHYLEGLDVSNWDVSKVTDMSYTFNACYKIESYDLSKWNTPNLTNMYATFRNNFALTTIDVSGIDTSNVTDFGRTFENASNLVEIVGLNNWNTSKVTRMAITFRGCSKLNELDLSSWDTSSVVNMCAAFYDCSNLETIYVSDKWNISKLSDEVFDFEEGIPSGSKHHIFMNCSKLIGGKDTAYTINNVNYSTNTNDSSYARIDGGASNPGYLTSITEGKLVAKAIYSETDNSLRFYKNTDKVNIGDTYKNLIVTNIYTGFETEVYNETNLPPWINEIGMVSDVTVVDKISPISTSYWFYLNRNEYYDLTNLDTSNVTDMSYMFVEDDNKFVGMSYVIIGMDNWDTSKVKNMSHMFATTGIYSRSYNIGDLSDWDTSNVEDMSYMFAYSGPDARMWSVGDLSGWNTSKVTNFKNMFSNAGYESTGIQLDLSGWNTKNATNMTNMFYDMRRLEVLIVSDQFSFTGNGSTECYLPEADAEYFGYTYALWEEEGSPGFQYDSYTLITDCIDRTFILAELCCFVEGSQVLVSLEGTTKAIEEFKAGDIVVSYDIEKGENYLAEVQGLILNKHSINMAKVYLEDGSMVDMTEYHPIYTSEGFHSITNHMGYDTLVEGDFVKTINGWSKVVEIELYTIEPITTYNLAIKDLDEIIDNEENDCFYVNGILAHNGSMCYQ